MPINNFFGPIFKGFRVLVLSAGFCRIHMFDIVPYTESMGHVNQTLGIPLHLHYTNWIDTGMKSWKDINSQNGLKVS